MKIPGLTQMPFDSKKCKPPSVSKAFWKVMGLFDMKVCLLGSTRPRTDSWLIQIKSLTISLSPAVTHPCFHSHRHTDTHTHTHTHAHTHTHQDVLTHTAAAHTTRKSMAQYSQISHTLHIFTLKVAVPSLYTVCVCVCVCVRNGLHLGVMIWQIPDGYL